MGRIFAVPAGRHVRYPAFQFTPSTGQPRPVKATVLAHDEPAVIRAAAQGAQPVTS